MTASAPTAAPDWRQRLRLWSWGAGQVVRHGRPARVYAHNGGVGDVLMLAQAVHQWRQAHPGVNVWALTHHGTLFAHNTDGVHALPLDVASQRLLGRLGVPLTWLHYATRDERTDRDTPPPRHLIAEMCRIAGVSGAVPLVPRLELTPGERDRGAAWADAVCIQSTSAQARYPILTKEWGAERFAIVSAGLAAQGVRVIQVGSQSDPVLPGAEDRRGRTALRELGAGLSQARLFVGLVGGLMHLARAVDCPAVIVYGGRERPEQSGYACNTNLVRQPECSPCWGWTRCDHSYRCMREIAPEDVLASVMARLHAPRGPLTVERADIAPAGLATA